MKITGETGWYVGQGNDTSWEPNNNSNIIKIFFTDDDDKKYIGMVIDLDNSAPEGVVISLKRMMHEIRKATDAK